MNDPRLTPAELSLNIEEFDRRFLQPAMRLLAYDIRGAVRLDTVEWPHLARKAFQQTGCETVADVRRLGEPAFWALNGIGRRTIEEIRDFIGGWVGP